MTRLWIPEIFSEGMVLQCRKPIPVWGRGPDGGQVTISIGGQQKTAAVESGCWKVQLEPLQPATGLVLTVCCGEQERTIPDVAVGEVWVAGGQSNMEFQLQYDAEKDDTISSADDEYLRFFDVPKISYEGQEKDFTFNGKGFWRPFDPENAGWFSAVGAYFGCQIRKTQKVPVGIIGCNWGGTSASAWLSEKYLYSVPALSPYLDQYRQTLSVLDMELYRKYFRKKLENERTPQAQKVLATLMADTVSNEQALAFFASMTEEQKAMASLPVGPMHPNRPCGLYHTMLQTIVPYAVRGVIWYQGESDEVLPRQYAALFSQVIACWRDAWQEQLPFLFVQLAPFAHWLTNTGRAFPELRRQQEIVSRTVPRAWMASIMDSGQKDDIHPKHKRPAGERLALLARGKVYGEKELLCEPPQAQSVDWHGDKVCIRFLHAGKGLHCAGETLAGMELLLDGNSVPFNTEIEGDTVTLYAPLQDAESVEVRYAWADYVKANLYSSAGLCAIPFCLFRNESTGKGIVG